MYSPQPTFAFDFSRELDGRAMAPRRRRVDSQRQQDGCRLRREAVEARRHGCATLRFVHRLQSLRRISPENAVPWKCSNSMLASAAAFSRSLGCQTTMISRTGGNISHVPTLASAMLGARSVLVIYLIRVAQQVARKLLEPLSEVIDTLRVELRGQEALRRRYSAELSIRLESRLVEKLIWRMLCCRNSGFSPSIVQNVFRTLCRASRA